jgi:hypothetical protein
MEYLEEAIRKCVDGVRPSRSPKDYVYIFSPDIFSSEKHYKLGWSKDWSRREKDLRTACPRGRMVFVLPCEEGRKLESRMFNVLGQADEVHVVGEVVHGLDFSVLRHLFVRLSATDTADEKNREDPSANPTVTHEVCQNPSTVAAPTHDASEPSDHSRAKLIMKKDSAPNIFYYRYLDDESTKKMGPWTTEELRLLHQLIATNGAREWGVLSRQVPGRVGYQCRNAYHSAAYKSLYGKQSKGD